MRRLLLACLAVLFISPASFASFNVKFNGTGYGQNGSVTVGGTNIGTFFVGQLSFQHHYVNSSSPGSQFNTFCIDLVGRITGGLVYQVDEQSLSTFIPPDNVARMAFLFDTYGDNSAAPAPSGNENKWFAALQLAFWKLSLTSSTSFTSSLLTSDSTILGYFNDFVTNFAVPSSYDGPGYGGVEWLKRDTSANNPNNVGQHLLYNPPQLQQPPPQVPAPAGLVLAATGGAFFSLMGFGRRFRRTI
jgi:hypothetical protein